MKLKPLTFYTGTVNDPDKVQRPLAQAIPLDPEGVKAYLQAALGYTEADAEKLSKPE